MLNFYIDFSFGGIPFETYEVLKPTWSYRLSESGTCSWSIALTQTNAANNTPISADRFAPKRTDFSLRAGGVNLIAGRLLDVGLESDTGLIQCSGKDWLEYLDQPFPFDYTLTPLTYGDNIAQTFRAYVAAAGTDTTNIKYNATQQKIITNIIAAANGLSDIAYTTDYQGTGWSQVLEFNIDYLDPTTMLAHIQTIAAYGAPLGFDFWCDAAKVIHFYSPRRTNPSSVVTVFDLVYGVDAVTKVTWHNSGPKATRTVGKGGPLWRQRNYPDSITQFREYLEIIELGPKYQWALTETQFQRQIDVATDAIGTLDWNPQKDITLTVDPSRLNPVELIGYLPIVGQAISFDSGSEFMPYHRINAKYYVVSQDFTPQDDAGNFLMDLGLQQIYAN